MLNVGVIGIRNHAGRIIDILDESPRARVTKIYHPDKLTDRPEATKRLEDLLDCDAVFILSPNDTHFNYLNFFWRNFSGYVFCEKPPVTSLVDFEALECNPSKVFFNFNMRFSRLRDIIERSVENGDLGQPFHCSMINSQGLAYKPEYIKSWRSKIGRHKHGILETKTIHYIDLLQYLFGDIKSYTYLPSNISGNGTAYDTSYCSISYENGLTASLLASYAAPYTMQISLLGTNGRIEFRDGNIEVFSPRDTFDRNGFFVSPPVVFAYDQRDEKVDHYKESLVSSVDYFLAVCESEGAFPEILYKRSMDTNRFILDLLG